MDAELEQALYDAEEDKALNAAIERFWYEFYFGDDEDRCRFHDHADPPKEEER